MCNIANDPPAFPILVGPSRSRNQGSQTVATVEDTIPHVLTCGSELDVDCIHQTSIPSRMGMLEPTWHRAVVQEDLDD